MGYLARPAHHALDALVTRRACSPTIAVPRDLVPAIHELDGCYLYDIDDLQAVVAETIAGRRRDAERAETIVNGFHSNSDTKG